MSGKDADETNAHVKPSRGLRPIMLTSVSSRPLTLLPFFSLATCTRGAQDVSRPAAGARMLCYYTCM